MADVVVMFHPGTSYALVHNRGIVADDILRSMSRLLGGKLKLSSYILAIPTFCNGYIKELDIFI